MNLTRVVFDKLRILPIGHVLLLGSQDFLLIRLLGGESSTHIKTMTLPKEIVFDLRELLAKLLYRKHICPKDVYRHFKNTCSELKY